jgi:NAD(P)-dependent dehydrogenase (short-subunit alcohol dehydrogenase family)
MWTKQTYGAFDALVNNAGILLERIYGDAENIETDALHVEIDVVKQVLETNLLGPLRAIQHFAPSLRSGGWVVSVSSQMAQLAWADGNMADYRLSKTALKGISANLAPGPKEQRVTVNCCCPGRVLIDMGSTHAMIDMEEGPQTPVWLVA